MTRKQFFNAMAKYDITLYPTPFGMLRTTFGECPICAVYNKAQRLLPGAPGFAQQQAVVAGSSLGLSERDIQSIVGSADNISTQDDDVVCLLYAFVAPFTPTREWYQS